MATAFDRYAPFIQNYIFKKQWKQLREVQVDACNIILDTNNHMIIASGTASGKTEAVFFPVLTELHNNPSKSVGVLYISPLKALINDQFERLDDLLDEQGINVIPWHGDVSQSVKNKALKSENSIIQITPESLESIVMKRKEDVIKLFGDLRFIIIDEIHALMGMDRGLQVMCLISRIEQLAKCKPRRIGLSATLNEYSSVERFLKADTLNNVSIVGLGKTGRKLRLRVNHDIYTDKQTEDDLIQSQRNDAIYEYIKNLKTIIFVNSRTNAEYMGLELKDIAENKNENINIFVHHGNISKNLREEAEHDMRNLDIPITTIATVTLELGIDIGDLDSTLQMNAPMSCSSFVQRLGRSGRRTGVSEMAFYTSERSLDLFSWELLKTIAVIELYLKEHWVEPISVKKKPFSLVIHQTLSVLYSQELSARDLARCILNLPPFKNKITLDEYGVLLKYLLEKEYIQKLETGKLIIGLKAEPIVNHFTFYSVFSTLEEYSVVNKGIEIGKIPKNSCGIYNVGDIFTLSGKKWSVLSVDDERLVLTVEKSKSKKYIKFISDSPDIHDKVVKKMYDILNSQEEIKYLNETGKNALENSRIKALNFNIAKSSIFKYSGKILIFPWCGDVTLSTIEKMLSLVSDKLNITKIDNADYYIEIISKMDFNEFVITFNKIDFEAINFNEENLDIPYGVLLKDKYDNMVKEELLKIAYINNSMDIKSAKEVLNRIQKENMVDK